MAPVSRRGVVCFGGAVLDRKLHLLAEAVAGTSNPAVLSTAAGGVARNVAENLANLGVTVRLVSIVGADAAGLELIEQLTACALDVSGVRRSAFSPTAQYVAILDPRNDLVLAAAAMEIFSELSDLDMDAVLHPGDPADPSSELIFADCNLPAPTLAHLIDRCAEGGRTLAVDAVSVPKAARLPARLNGIGLLFCNLDEALAILAASPASEAPERERADPLREGSSSARRLVDRGVRVAIVTAGARGAWVATDEGVRAVPALSTAVVDVTGAGDALVAGVLSQLTLSQLTLSSPARTWLALDRVEGAVQHGVELASLTIASSRSTITPRAGAPGVTRRQESL